jgi:drug/metabolite transporter (DMT)-like permease
MARQYAWLTPSLSLIIACAFWAAGTVVSKELLGSVPPVLFLIIQLAPSVAVLWAAVVRNGTSLPVGRVLFVIVLLGWLNPGVSYTLSMLGLAHTSASVATLMWATEPALIVMLAWLALREQVSFPIAILTATAAIGVYFASGMATQGLSLQGETYGAALILLGVLCCAIYTIVSRDIAASVDPMAIIAIQQTLGLVWVLCIWPFEWRGSALGELSRLTSIELLGGLISGLMYYALAFWFYLNGLRSMTASRAGNFLNLIPVFGITFAYAFLSERLSVLQWVGALVILISVLKPSTVCIAKYNRPSRRACSGG